MQLDEFPLPADEGIRFLGQMGPDLVHVSFPSGAGNTLSVNLRDRFPGATSPSHAKQAPANTVTGT